MRAERLAVTLVYALPERQHVIELEVPAGSTLRNVAERAVAMPGFPSIDLAAARIGVFGVVRDPGTLVQANDRVEIYRPLDADPKLARRRRAATED